MEFNKREAIKVIVALCLIAAILIPIFVLGSYAIPSADDFNAYNTQMTYPHESAIENALNATKDYYNEWNGVYSGAFISNLIVYFASDIMAFTVVCQFFILFFMLSLLLLVRTVVKQICRVTQWSITLFLFAGITLLMTQFLPPGEFFYWYSGMTAYMLPLTFLFLFLVGLLRALAAKNQKSRIGWTVLAAVLGFLVCGNPLFFVGLLGVGMFCLTIWAFVKKLSFRWVLLGIFAAVLVGAILNVAAPGNYIRLAVETGKQVQPRTLTHVVWTTVDFLVRMTGKLFIESPMAAVVFISTPFLFRMVQKVKFAFPNPCIAVVITVFVAVAMVFPVKYVYMEGYEPGRILNAVNTMLVLLIMFDALYIVGWLNRKYDIEPKTAYQKVGVLALSGVALLVSLQAHPVSSWLSYDIVNNLVNHTIQQNHAETMLLLKEIEESPDMDVLVEKVSVVYPNLNQLIISEDAEFWCNQSIAEYYGKNSVATRGDAD